LAYFFGEIVELVVVGVGEFREGGALFFALFTD
jgi:hypothetical protein